MIGIFLIGTRGFGTKSVIGFSLFPRPPAKMIAFNVQSSFLEYKIVKKLIKLILKNLKFKKSRARNSSSKTSF